MRFLILLLFCSAVWAQPKTTLTPKGFTPATIDRPNFTSQRLIDASRAWADAYNKIRYDVYNISESGVAIDGLRENAFFYRNRGEAYHFTILYTLQVKFGEAKCELLFSVKEIYADKTPIESSITDYFTPDGRIKEGFEDVKKSIEETANRILQSYAATISR